jgi:hypothetical protein
MLYFIIFSTTPRVPFMRPVREFRLRIKMIGAPILSANSCTLSPGGSKRFRNSGGYISASSSFYSPGKKKSALRYVVGPNLPYDGGY